MDWDEPVGWHPPAHNSEGGGSWGSDGQREEITSHVYIHFMHTEMYYNISQ